MMQWELTPTLTLTLTLAVEHQQGQDQQQDSPLGCWQEAEPTAIYQLPIANCQLPAAICRLPTAVHQSVIDSSCVGVDVDVGVGVGGCRLLIVVATNGN
ncbi:hypothetical protein AWZ03_011623 [Drosophila navojoa]|uniref:Uncharacterized protein n=1 Tax=Drosophila navojoa TaxID=7232 RepID=A0A484AZY8_DRONA|nr:hypothetical protein AWZ03_011623 [Drosophila navojoa]